MEVRVIGGGLGLALDFRDRVVARMRPEIYADSTRDLAVLPGELGAHAGVIGAALAAAAAAGERRIPAAD